MAADSDGEPEVGYAPLPHISLIDKVPTNCGVTAGNRRLIQPTVEFQLNGAADEDYDLIQTVFTCDGNISDPDFPERLTRLLEQLSTLLCTRKEVLMNQVQKIEPWNSVRVTLTIPREAAVRLRALAASGDAALQALGILSVQVEGDQVISLRLAPRFTGGEPQEIVLRTNTANGNSPTCSSTSQADNNTVLAASVAATGTLMGPPVTAVSALLNAVSTPQPSHPQPPVFRSPNVVAPQAGGMLLPPPVPTNKAVAGGSKVYPFASMVHAAQAHHARESSHHNFTPPQPPPPPLYHSKPSRPLPTDSSAPSPTTPPTSALSSPLLINLLQTDGKDATSSATTDPSHTVPNSSALRPPPPRTPVNHHHQHLLGRRINHQQQQPVRTMGIARGVQQVQRRFAVPASAPRGKDGTPTSNVTRGVVIPSNSSSVIQGYSQFTALSSKPCATQENADTNDDKKATEGNKLIVNPLTGELEPMPSESSESEEEPANNDSFLYSPSPSGKVFSDEETGTNRRTQSSQDNPTTPNSADLSTEPSDLIHLSNCISENPKKQLQQRPSTESKIKIRFMVDKSTTEQLSPPPQPQQQQPTGAAYKVDVSFVNATSGGTTSRKGNGTSGPSVTGVSKPMSAVVGSTNVGSSPVVSATVTAPLSSLSSSLITTTGATSSGSHSSSGDPLASSGSGNITTQSTTVSNEEPRVPPLHISLRGRNATVVPPSNKKKSPLWSSEGDSDVFNNKLAKKKGKDGRDGVAIGNCDVQMMKPKRVKVRRLASATGGSSSPPAPPISPSSHHTSSPSAAMTETGESSGLKLKIPVAVGSPPLTDFADERLSKKRRDSKKIRNNLRHLDPSSTDSVAADPNKSSEEWISRTLKEETLRQSGSLDSDDVKSSENVVINHDFVVASVDGHSVVIKEEETRVHTDDAPEPSVERTNAFKHSANFELSELLRRNTMENALKPDGVKLLGTNLLELSEQLQLQHEEVEAAATEVAVRKPQEIGGKIKSELSSKIDRVSGKLKNDLSKEGTMKKKLDETTGKGPKSSVRLKVKADGEDGAAVFGRAKRRYSGDQSTSESQAQRVKRSSSSDQPIGASPKPLVTRKIRKDSVIDRLRKDKLSKVLAVTNNKVSDINSKKLHANRVAVPNISPTKLPSNPLTPAKTANPSETSETSEVPLEVDGKPQAGNSKMDAAVCAQTTATATSNGSGTGNNQTEGNTQGEDSGIESMDALSEKSPNQGESPCRKEDGKEAAGEDAVGKGQNHDRLEEEDRLKDAPSSSCLNTSSTTTHTTAVIPNPEPSQAPTVPSPVDEEPSNNTTAAPSDLHIPKSSSSTLPAVSNPAEDPKPDATSTNNVVPLAEVGSFEVKIREAFQRETVAASSSSDICGVREGLGAKILEGKAAAEGGTTQKESQQDIEVESGKDWPKDQQNKIPIADDHEHSPSLEDIERFRVNPPLYTYAKREESLSPSPTTPQPQIALSESGVSSKSNSTTNHLETEAEKKEATGRNLRGNSNKSSLLEQLLIEIPEDTRRTRSWHNKLGNSPCNTPKSSPRPVSPATTPAMPARASPRNAKVSPTATGTASSATSATLKRETTNKRPSKRKCSENAQELIKACIEDGKGHHGRAGSQQPACKKGDVDSSDDEPLSDLARSREHSVEQEVKGALLIKTKSRTPIQDDEIRNNNKISLKSGEAQTTTTTTTTTITTTTATTTTTTTAATATHPQTPATRRSVRQTAIGSANSKAAALKGGSCASGANDVVVRAVRATRSAVSLDPNMDTSNSKRRRISRDTK